jgi:uncharacterized protein (TIGR02453 family)
MVNVLEFQKKVARNNDREWFQQHKEEYLESEKSFRAFVTDLQETIKLHDTLDDHKTKIYRIYRDVRFSNDKTPYTKHRSVSFARAGEERRGGYYLKIQPKGQSYLAGGFWRPEPADLLHIRNQISTDPSPLRELQNSYDFKHYFNGLEGEKLKTAPKGFEKDDPSMDLLKYKGFIVTHPFKDSEVTSKDFILKVSEGFQKMRPFFNYMSEILTTDSNGVSLIDR